MFTHKFTIFILLIINLYFFLVPDFLKTTGSTKVNNHKNTLTSYDLTLSKLISANLHLGHSKTLWNPMNSSFIYGIRHGINIINLDHTIIYLRRACKIVNEISYRGGIII